MRKLFSSIKKIKFNPTKIGILFLILSIAISFSIIPLFLAIFIGGIFEIIISFFVKIKFYPDFAFKVLLIFFLTNITFIIVLIRMILHNLIQRKHLYFIFILFYFSNQSVSNYLLWYLDCNFCGYKDGQLFFRFLDFKPVLITSLIFLIQGLIIDFIVRFLRKFQFFDPIINRQRKDKEKELNFESKVNDLIAQYQNKSLEELKDIEESEKWTVEARKAASICIKQRFEL